PKDRPAADLDHWLGAQVRLFADARPESACQDDAFHKEPSAASWSTAAVCPPMVPTMNLCLTAGAAHEELRCRRAVSNPRRRASATRGMSVGSAKGAPSSAKRSAETPGGVMPTMGRSAPR